MSMRSSVLCGSVVRGNIVAEKKALFPIKFWNVYYRTVANLPWSNNSIEEWHNAFAKRVAIAHRNVAKLIEKIGW